MYAIRSYYVGNFNLLMDRDHQHDIFAYGDSIANAALGYNLRGDGINPLPIQLFGDNYNVYGAGGTGYSYQKDSYSSISGKLNFVHQIGRTHEIKVGGVITSYSIHYTKLYEVVVSCSVSPRHAAVPFLQRPLLRTQELRISSRYLVCPVEDDARRADVDEAHLCVVPVEGFHDVRVAPYGERVARGIPALFGGRTDLVEIGGVAHVLDFTVIPDHQVGTTFRIV